MQHCLLADTVLGNRFVPSGLVGDFEVLRTPAAPAVNNHRESIHLVQHLARQPAQHEELGFSECGTGAVRPSRPMACVPPSALKPLGHRTLQAHFSIKLSIWAFESSLVDEGVEAMGGKLRHAWSETGLGLEPRVQ